MHYEIRADYGGPEWEWVDEADTSEDADWLKAEYELAQPYARFKILRIRD